VIQWDPDPCACGRTFRVIRGGVIGRADDITKVKGVLFSPAAVEAVVRSFDGLGDEYELVVKRPGDVDHITLKVELRPGVGQADVEPGLRDQLRLKTNLGYEILFADYGSLPRYKLKARRFKDLRKKS
jgi:phenylacetate-CoA ligase